MVKQKSGSFINSITAYQTSYPRSSSERKSTPSFNVIRNSKKSQNSRVSKCLISRTVKKKLGQYTPEGNSSHCGKMEDLKIDIFNAIPGSCSFVSSKQRVGNRILEDVIGDISAVTMYELGEGKKYELRTSVEKVVNSIKDTLKVLNITGSNPDQRNLTEKKYGISKSIYNSEVRLNLIRINKTADKQDDDVRLPESKSNSALHINTSTAFTPVLNPRNFPGFSTGFSTPLQRFKSKPVTMTIQEKTANSNSMDSTIAWSGKRLETFLPLKIKGLDNNVKYNIKDSFYGQNIEYIFDDQPSSLSDNPQAPLTGPTPPETGDYRPFKCNSANINFNFSSYCRSGISYGEGALGVRYKDITFSNPL